ncbi:hypothetical protein TNCV_2543631 [Trichonephila clavipes]|nr:hypothetical protein TNCV_2543631 [Trichonephila clavipes]
MNSRNETIFLLPKTDLGLFDLPELDLSSTGKGLENIAKTLRSKSSYTPAYDPEESTTPVRSAMTFCRYNDIYKKCLCPNYGRKDILEFAQSSKNIIDADSGDENEISDAAPVEMRNVMNSMRSYLDARSNGGMITKWTISDNLLTI